MAFFTDSSAIKKFSRLRAAYAVISVLAFLGTEFLRLKLRPEVYASGNGPRWLFDTIGNSGGAVVQIYFTLAILHSSFRQALRVIGFIVVGYSIYEVLQPVLPKGTYDINDIVATVVGGVVALVILVLLRAIFGDRPNWESK